MKGATIIFLFLISGLLIAQDSTNTYEDYLNDNVFDFIYKSHPMIEINYGFGTPEISNLRFNYLNGPAITLFSSFANIRSWDIKFGKSEQKRYEGLLVDLNERYIFGSYLSSSIQNISETDNEITTKTYRFGFGSRDGLGYGSSAFSFIPYISQDFVWTKLSEFQTNRPEGIKTPDFDAMVLDDYLDNFRFGDKSSYGIKIELASMIQLNANYETSVVYRRHLFWYWSGSMLLSQVGYNLLTQFTDDIVDRSPVIGTIFNFALKAGYQYGYYLLRKEDMNWPLNTSGNEAPLTFETFNFGVSFIF